MSEGRGSRLSRAMMATGALSSLKNKSGVLGKSMGTGADLLRGAGVEYRVPQASLRNSQQHDRRPEISHLGSEFSG